MLYQTKHYAVICFLFGPNAK